MTRARPLYMPTPRIWDETQTAARLGKGVTWWGENRDRFEAAGFPPVDDFLGGRDADAIDLWIDRRSNIADAEPVNDNDLVKRRLEGLRNGTV